MKASQGILIIALAGLGVLIFFAPRQGSDSGAETVPYTEADRMIDSAIALVQEGSNPMSGIMMLRQVLVEDSNNVRAQFEMGVFSLQSGQYQKAVQRFEKVKALAPEEIRAYLFLGHAYAGVGDKNKGIENYEVYKALLSDPNEVREIEARINELKKL